MLESEQGHMFASLGTIPNIILTSIWAACVITCLIIEPILNVSWNKTYFTKGLPIFTIRVSATPRYNNIPPISRLQARFHSGWFLWDTSLVFKELDVDSYGFREKNFSRPLYPVIMHGMLFFDESNAQVVATGFMNWWMLGVLVVGLELMFAAFSLYVVLLIFLPFALAFAVSYRIQSRRFSKVAEFAAHAWTRQLLSEKNGPDIPRRSAP